MCRYDGKDVYCLPKAREAINTGVSIINSALKRISYRRIEKWQSRGVKFAVPSFISVNVKQREQVTCQKCLVIVKDKKKLLRVLALAKMVLLREYDITFDVSNNLRSWDNEYAFGHCINNNNRGIDKTLSKYMSFFGIQFERHHQVHDDDPVFYWDSSCGGMGVNYCKASTTIWDCQILEEEELRTKWTIVREKWTWEGAPEFRDWNYNAKERVESAFIRMVPHVIDIVVPKVAPQSSYEFSFTDSLQNEWTLHFVDYPSYLEISLELNNPSRDIVPLIGMYHVVSENLSVKYDITHLFDENQPISMEVKLHQREMDKLQMKVDIRVMQLVFPYS